MLNFNDKTENRKYVCFVCGIHFDNIYKMNDHIIKIHEEGREYIKCPACNFCIRDLKVHYKVRHSTRKCPTKGMMKAMIWKDISIKGKVKTRKPSFREGTIISAKNGGKEMHYRSAMECEFYECLEDIPSVLHYDVEPIKNGIPYLFDGKEHKYYPDLSIHFIDGKIEIWEIKPASQTDLPVNNAKWRAAKIYCEARGWDFTVMTEVTLGRLKKLVKQAKVLNE